MAKSESKSPTTKGEEARAEAERERAEETRTTHSEIGKDSNGNPVLRASDIDAVRTQYNLTGPEAEQLITSGKVNESEAAKLRDGRAVYRQAYEQVTNSPTTPEAVRDLRAAANEAEAKSAGVEVAADPALPTSGPYGPNVDYSSQEAPQDKDHVPTVVTAPAAHLLTEEG